MRYVTGDRRRVQFESCRVWGYEWALKQVPEPSIELSLPGDTKLEIWFVLSEKPQAMRRNEFPIEGSGDKSQVCSTFIVVQPLNHISLCYPMGCSRPGSPVFHYLLQFAQTHVHWVDDAIQTSLPLWSPSPPTFSLSQHQGPFQWVGSLHQVAKVSEPRFQHQSFQWIVRIVFL